MLNFQILTILFVKMFAVSKYLLYLCSIKLKQITMTKLNITPGKWEQSALNKLRVKAYIPNVMHGTFIPQNADDVLLIADAGTTYNECGLLPSELLKQRDELLEALRNLIELQLTDERNQSIKKAKQAIQNAEYA